MYLRLVQIKDAFAGKESILEPIRRRGRFVERKGPCPIRDRRAFYGRFHRETFG